MNNKELFDFISVTDKMHFPVVYTINYNDLSVRSHRVQAIKILDESDNRYANWNTYLEVISEYDMSSNVLKLNNVYRSHEEAHKILQSWMETQIESMKNSSKFYE